MPKFIDDPLFQLLREGNVEEFNQRRKAGEEVDLTDCDFRNCDMRGLDADDLNLAGAYFRGADIRGVDFRQSKLAGASLAGAQISGCYFPKELHPAEIDLSITHGTRLRYEQEER